MYKVLLSEEAEWDLDEIFDWHEAQRAGLGESFAVAYKQVEDRLARTPYLYQEHLLFLRRAGVGRFPYHVFYAVDEPGGEVQVVAILHQNRDPAALRQRINLI